MVIRHHYHEVLSFGESLMIFIIRALQEREQYQRLTHIVEQVFPGAGNFKLPSGDKAVRITFAEGVQLLREAGIEAGEYDDLR
jgi:aspartyl-tRNA synthetase